MFTFSCPACDKALQTGPDGFGKKIFCKHCGQKLLIPTPPSHKTAIVKSSSLKQQPRAADKQPSLSPSPPKPELFFLAKGGQRLGPYSVLDLEKYYAEGRFEAQDMVLPSGGNMWIPADEALPFLAGTAATEEEEVSTSNRGVSVLAVINWFRAHKARWMSLVGGVSAIIMVIFVRWLFTGNPSPVPSPTPEVQAKQSVEEKKDTAGKSTGQRVYDQVLKSTVWINNPGMGSGSGALVNAEEKIVVTNYHVVFQNRKLPPSSTPLETHESQLTQSDPRDAKKFPFKIFEHEFGLGNVYIIDMVSNDFDAYLQVLNAFGQVLAFDDDSGGNLNARLRFTPQFAGKYRIMATTFDGRIGAFTLRISKFDPKGTSKATPVSVASYLIVQFPEYQEGKLVVDKVHYIRNSNTQKDRFKATVLAHSEGKDLALLKLDEVPAGAPVLPLAKDSSQPGQTVHSIGNPGGSGALWVYTSGTVRTSAYLKQWQSFGAGGLFRHFAKVIETQSPTNPGDSGGPLVNDQGELVALTQGGSLDANSISLFVDVGEVRDFLKKNNITWTEN